MSLSGQQFFNLLAALVCSVAVGVAIAKGSAGWAAIDAVLVALNVFFVLIPLEDDE